MKIARFIYDDEIYYGKVVPRDNKIIKLDGDLYGEYYLTEKEFSLDQARLLSPVLPPNIIAIGLNYRQHARESGHDIPERPVIFLKATTSLTGPGSRIMLPAEAPDKVDFEAELAIIIGRRAKNITPEEVDDYVLGYTCANDVSARDCQQEYDEQWARAKSFDTFCPLGPWIATGVNPDDLTVRSLLNDKVMQDSRTEDMIFKPQELISYCSRNMTLLPGTVILTGTPEGVGMARRPPVYLESGDEIKIEIENIGILKNKVGREKKDQKPGHRVLTAWRELGGTTQITPGILDKIKSFIDDGMEEELITEVMKYSKEQVQGSPFAYMFSILNDYLKQGIYSLNDYHNVFSGGKDDGEGIQKINRRKKAAAPEQDLEELYKKGYR